MDYWEFIRLIYGLEADLRAWAGLFPFSRKQAADEGFCAHADDVVIKQYDSLRHCVLFILIEE
jgi:hypothetical protein